MTKPATLGGRPPSPEQAEQLARIEARIRLRAQRAVGVTEEDRVRGRELAAVAALLLTANAHPDGGDGPPAESSRRFKSMARQASELVRACAEQARQDRLKEERDARRGRDPEKLLSFADALKEIVGSVLTERRPERTRPLVEQMLRDFFAFRERLTHPGSRTAEEALADADEAFLSFAGAPVTYPEGQLAADEADLARDQAAHALSLWQNGGIHRHAAEDWSAVFPRWYRVHLAVRNRLNAKGRKKRSMRRK